ncbi:MAG: hypothetical protein JF589_12265, partial [Gemmatimonadetes bacterium]|nr:hypothetical protein [Gemmatimonadota bacterium]
MLVLGIAAMLVRDFVYRPMIVMHRVGLAGLFAEQGRQCDLRPVREWHACYTRRPRATQSAGEEEQVLMARGTRQVTQAMHVWQTPDSATWWHLRDSIAIALDGWGGQRIPSFPYDTLRRLAWRFDEQDVQLS